MSHAPFLFNSVIADVLLNALDSIQGFGTELLLGNHAIEFQFSEDTALLGSDLQIIWTVLSGLMAEAIKYGVIFVQSKFKVLLQNWHPLAPVLISERAQLEQVRFIYLWSRISADGTIGRENNVIKCYVFNQ